jgi:hypothetical protein
MRFFIPNATDDVQAEQVYTATKTFVEQQTSSPLIERRIYSVGFKHNGVDYIATVGRIFERLGEEVIAIVEGYIFYLCTGNRGVIRGEPYLIGREEVNWIKDFDPEPPLTPPQP